MVLLGLIPAPFKILVADFFFCATFPVIIFVFALIFCRLKDQKSESVNYRYCCEN
jgi:hypothetical protein